MTLWGGKLYCSSTMNDVMTGKACLFEVPLDVCACVCQVNRRCATGQVRLAASRECVSPSFHSCNITCGPHGGTLDVEMGMWISFVFSNSLVLKVILLKLLKLDVVKKWTMVSSLSFCFLPNLPDPGVLAASVSSMFLLRSFAILPAFPDCLSSLPSSHQMDTCWSASKKETAWSGPGWGDRTIYKLIISYTLQADFFYLIFSDLLLSVCIWMRGRIFGSCCLQIKISPAHHYHCTYAAHRLVRL